MNPLTQSKNTTIPPVLIALTLACFGLSPQARAVCRQGCDFIHANAFLGDDALGSNTSGSGNTAIGFEVLQSNTTGFFNTANGSQALQHNTTGFSNTANGVAALLNNTTGNDNTATGAGALVSNTTGSFNTANGISALSSNTTGFNNTANGWYALQMTTGSNNIAVGAEAGINLTSGNNNIDIGNPGIAGESRTIRVGTRQTHRATFIAGISGATVPAGVAVIVDGSGHLGTVVSSARFKDDIKPMEKASEAILALKPVTFRYKQELDPDGIPQFGLVAEEVEKVNPDLVARDEQEKPYSVRYEAVNAMLLNEFLKEHRKVEEQDRKIEELEATVAWQQRGFASAIAQQAKEIKALTSKIQKVSAELEARKSSPQIVLNNQ
jgi:Chaperone of endosialidase